MYRQIIYKPLETEKSSQFHLSNILAYIVSLTFFGLYLYVLISSHTSAVFDACGSHLWNTMLANIFVNLMLIGIVFCSAQYGKAGAAFASVAIFAVWLTIFSLLIHFAIEALNAPACNTAMSAATAFNAPMLAIFACLHAGLLGVYLLLMVCSSVWVGLAAASN